MQRRKFLQALGATVPANLAGQALASPDTASRPEPTPEPRVFFYDDGRHASGLYQFAPPLSPESFTFTVDQLVNSGVDTLFYSAGLEGGAAQYDSRVIQKWGDNVDVWSHEIFYRASRNLQQLIADGHDPMKLIETRCHEKGLWFFPTAPVCLVGGDRAIDLGYGRKSDFVLDHPQFYVGEGDNDPRVELLGRFFGPNRLNFLHPEVRRERFLLFEELLTRYESDGIELDLSLDNEFGPLCKFGEVTQLAPLLTQWIRDLWAVARKAEEAQGRRKRIYVRLPAGPPENWKLIGFEVATWVSEKLVDGLVCLSTNKKETPKNQILLLDQDLDLDAAVGLRRGTDCRVLAGFTTYLGRHLAKSATAPMIWAAAANAYDRGADGFGLASGMWAPNGWPWTSEEYQTLRLLGHPDLLATADKIYRARSLAEGARNPKSLFPIGGPILPLELAEGETVDIPIRIADRLNHGNEQGKVEVVRLRVRLTNFEPSLNEVRIALNGRPLPDSIGRRSDLHFRVVKQGPIGPYGYVFDYLLPHEYYPKPGENVVRVSLLRRDPKLNLPVEVYDVDCEIRYRVHQDFEDDPIAY